MDAQQGEESGRDHGGIQGLGLTGSRQSQTIFLVGGHFLEHLILRAPILKIHVGGAVVKDPLFGQRGVDADQLFRLGKGERPEQHRVNHAENCGVGADAEGEREYGDDGEAGIFPQHARAVADVLKENFDGAEGPHIAASLLQQTYVSKPAARGRAAGAGSCALLLEFFLAHGQMEAQFFVEVAVKLPALDQRFHAKPGCIDPFLKHRS